MGPTTRKRAFAVTAAAIAAVAFFAASAWASPGGPSPFRHDLRRIDGRLRMGIEYLPVELGEGLSTSETVCSLAEKVERQGAAEGAAADWSTLSQLVEELDRPAAGRIDGALQRAGTGLLDLRRRFSAAWPDRKKVAELGRGVARTREGIQLLRSAMEKIAEAFEAWPAHQCQAATEAIEAGIARIPSAVTRINSGMRVLWALADATD